MEQKKKYDQNAELRKREKILEEMYVMRETPEINPLSEMLV